MFSPKVVPSTTTLRIHARQMLNMVCWPMFDVLAVDAHATVTVYASDVLRIIQGLDGAVYPLPDLRARRFLDVEHLRLTIVHRVVWRVAHRYPLHFEGLNS